jgi:hypothetical protein
MMIMMVMMILVLMLMIAVMIIVPSILAVDTVTWELQICYTMLVQWCYSDLTFVQWCYSEVTVEP